MKKLFNWIKVKFFNKSFLSFIIIGILNTSINSIFVLLVSSIFVWVKGSEISSTDSLYPISTAVSTLVAYVLASLFSYFANARFTYNQKKKDAITFLEAALSFALRYGLTWLLTFLFGKLFALWLSSYMSQETITTIANLVASILMIPPFYFMLGYVFKRTKKRLEKEENNEEETIEEGTHEEIQ